MKIGYLQFSPILADPPANAGKIEALLRGKTLPELLVLPELANSGYNFTSYQQALNSAERIETSDFIQFLVSLCTHNGIHIVTGFNELDGEHLYNSAVLIAPQGWIGTYRKLHLFQNEKDFFQPGNLGLPVYDIGSCRIGLLICFDWLFPEVWRILALKGADMICHPCNLVLPGLAQRGVPIHALTNRIYTITANRTGSEGDLTYTGLSIIADPAGDILVQASQTDDEIAMVEVDPTRARDKYITARNHVLEDRRPAEYGFITSQITER